MHCEAVKCLGGFSSTVLDVVDVVVVVAGVGGDGVGRATCACHCRLASIHMCSKMARAMFYSRRP